MSHDASTSADAAARPGDEGVPAGEPVGQAAHFGAAAEWKTHIPVGYQVQLQHQMLVTGRRKAFIAVLLNSTAFKHHAMDFSPSFARKHQAKCTDFWRTYIERGELPPGLSRTEWKDATGGLLLTAALAPIIDGSMRINPYRLDVHNWTTTGGGFSFEVPDLQFVLPYITRGHVLQLQVGFVGMNFGTWERYDIGVVTGISGRGLGPFRINCEGFQAMLRSRPTTAARRACC